MNERALSLLLASAALAFVPAAACSSSPATGTSSTTSTSTGSAGGGGDGGGATTATTTTGAGGAVTTTGSGGSTEAADFGKAFPQDRVPRLDITVTKEQWKLMVDDLTALAGPFGGSGAGGAGGSGGAGGAMPGGIDGKPVYVDCDVATEERAWHHVGIRFKGNASLQGPWSKGIWKLPLRLTFDEYEDTYPETKNQRYYGFKDLSLFNGAGDPSLLRDKVGGDLFGDAAIPAPVAAFFRVFIDHGDGPTYFGVYTGLELPEDDAFLETAFGTHKYDLYQPDGLGGQWSVWDTATLGKENNKGDYTVAKALYDALHADRSDAAAWRAALDTHLDVDEFLHYLALNTVIEDGDTYGLVAHNYYLYAGKVGRFTWIPWNHGRAFSPEQGALSLGMAEVGDGWPLIRYLLDDPQYLAVYKGYLAQTVAHEYEPVAAGKRFQAAHDLIKPYVIGPEGEKPGYTFVASEAEFDAATAALIAHAAKRKQDVDAFLAP